MNAMSRNDFIEQKLFHQFLDILNAEEAGAGRDSVKTHLHNITREAANEWFKFLDEFLRKHPSVHDLIERKMINQTIYIYI